ncbi:MAG: LysR family transcriptional regulator [Pseudobacteriovorax sp.]|nr:LysR family transcriptional regulator [Pseudobacteriovorax sp.]
MDLTHLSIFTEVMKEGSFAAVAKKRHMSPSTVSRIVASLEDAAQVRLFERNTRTMEPTEQAMRLRQRLEPLLEEIDASFDELRDVRSEISGKLRITSPVSLGLTYLVPEISSFGRRFPKIDIEFLMTDQRIDIINDRIDIAFRFGHLNDSNFVSQKLTSLNYCVVASSAYLNDLSEIKDPKTLTELNCMSFFIPGFDRSWKFRKSERATPMEVPIQGNLQISNAIALREAALQGHGVALLPDFLIKDELKNGELIQLFTNFEVTASDYKSHIWIIFPSRRYLPQRTRVFIEHIKTHLQSKLETKR